MCWKINFVPMLKYVLETLCKWVRTESFQSCFWAFPPESQIREIFSHRSFISMLTILSPCFHRRNYTFNKKVTISGLLHESVAVPMHKVTKNTLTPITVICNTVRAVTSQSIYIYFQKRTHLWHNPIHSCYMS